MELHINDLLKISTDRGASDLHLKVGSHPVIRVDGKLLPLTDQKRLMQEDTIAMAFSIMSARQKQKFKDNFEIDMAYSVPGLGRFRVSVFQQRGTVGIVLRVIPVKINAIRELLLPPVLESISDEQSGLILVTGTTGSGKSTSLAAMIDYINTTRTEHIMTIEDPIEFLHRDKKSLSTSARSRSIRGRSRPPCAPPCVRTPTSSSSAKCETTRRSRRPSPPPRPAIWCSPPCTPSTPPRPSTASSPCSPRTSRSRCACSSRPSSRRSCRCAWSRGRTARGESPPSRSCARPPTSATASRTRTRPS